MTTPDVTARIEVVVLGERYVWAGPVKTLGLERPPREVGSDDEGWLTVEPGPELTVSLTFDEAELTERGLQP